MLMGIVVPEEMESISLANPALGHSVNKFNNIMTALGCN